MLNKGAIIVFAVLAFLLTDCSKCRNDDCPPHARFLFQVVDSYGRSLFDETDFVQTPDSNEIRVYGLDKTGNLQDVPLWQEDITFHFNVVKEYFNYFIDYGNDHAEVLLFKQEIINDECCSNYVTDYEVDVNFHGIWVSSEADSVFVFRR